MKAGNWRPLAAGTEGRRALKKPLKTPLRADGVAMSSSDEPVGKAEAARLPRSALRLGGAEKRRTCREGAALSEGDDGTFFSDGLGTSGLDADSGATLDGKESPPSAAANESCGSGPRVDVTTEGASGSDTVRACPRRFGGGVGGKMSRTMAAVDGHALGAGDRKSVV